MVPQLENPTAGLGTEGPVSSLNADKSCAAMLLQTETERGKQHKGKKLSLCSIRLQSDLPVMFLTHGS